jgi:Uma2 family endonuclease
VIRIAPDLCVEVLSPSTAKRDRGAKMQTFARFHVQEYWIADPEAASLEAYELTSEGYRLRDEVVDAGVLTSPVLPGLTIPVHEIFQKIV